MAYCNWSFFNTFSGLAHKNRLSRPFVFKMFPGLGGCPVSGHKVTMQSDWVRLEGCGIVYFFLLCTRGAEATNQPRRSEGVVRVSIAARTRSG